MKVKFQLFNIIRRQLTLQIESASAGAAWITTPPQTIVGQIGQAEADMPENSLVEFGYYLQDDPVVTFRFQCRLTEGHPVVQMGTSAEDEYSVSYNYLFDGPELVVNVDYRPWPGAAPAAERYRQAPSDQSNELGGPTVAERLTYNVTLVESGAWLHAPGSDFLFAYLDKGWNAKLRKKVTEAFETALGMSSAIKKAVKKTSGQDVANGLYLLNQPAMTKAMTTIHGMGQTTDENKHESGSGTAVSINQQFFSAVLAGLGGDVAPLMAYLTEEMGDLQAQTKKSTVTDVFGTVIGLISVMPILEVPVTTFQYVYSDTKTSEWFVKIPCGSVKHESYDYRYNVVNYNYDKPSVKA